LESSRPIDVFVCDEQPIVLEGVARVFAEYSDLHLAGSAANLATTLSALVSGHFDVLLLGQPPTARSALPLLAGLTGAHLPTPVVLWVAELGEMDVFRALQMGAKGILRRTTPVSSLVDCLRNVAADNVWLDPSMTRRAHKSGPSARITVRERQVIEYVCRGFRNRDIAAAMNITPGTVKVHLMHIFEKTGARDRFALALQAQQILGAAKTEPQAADLPPVS
jgi:DNA-binding NarL/FixJ family response regulator